MPEASRSGPPWSAMVTARHVGPGADRPKVPVFPRAHCCRDVPRLGNRIAARGLAPGLACGCGDQVNADSCSIRQIRHFRVHLFLGRAETHADRSAEIPCGSRSRDPVRIAEPRSRADRGAEIPCGSDRAADAAGDDRAVRKRVQGQRLRATRCRHNPLGEISWLDRPAVAIDSCQILIGVRRVRKLTFGAVVIHLAPLPGA